MAIILAAALTLTPVVDADVWLTERLEHEDLSVRLLDQWRELTDVPRETSRDSAVPATRSTTTTTRPPPTAVPEGVEQWRPLVEAHFPTDAVDRMLCLMWHESRGNPSARNPNSTATGLLQVMHSVW